MQFHGNLENPYSVGTNNLIKDGACLVTDCMDILKNYPQFLNRKLKTFHKKTKEKYKEIYNCLSSRFMSIDEISIKTNKNVREVMSLLTLMEMEGLVLFEVGRGYKLK